MRRSIVASLLALVLTANAAAQSKKTVGAYLLALAGDAATTNYAIEHGQHEMNPLVRPWAGSRQGRIVGFSLCGAATLGTAYLLAHTRHRRAAKALLVIETADHGFGAGWNLRRNP